MLIHNRQMSDIQARELRHCSRALQYSSITLETAPQDYLFTLLNLTSFQRLFLETLACYDYFTIWEERKRSTTSLPLDMSIMGAFTCNTEQAEEFNQIGVPVWIVRHCSQLTRTMKVGIPVFARDPDGCVLAPHPRAGSVYKGHPSAVRNRICQGLRLQQVKLGHAAYEQQPGEALHGMVIFFIAVYLLMNFGSFWLSCSLSWLPAPLTTGPSTFVDIHFSTTATADSGCSARPTYARNVAQD